MAAKRFIVALPTPQKGRRRSQGLSFTPPRSAPEPFKRARSNKNIGPAQALLDQGFSALIENFGGAAALAERLDVDPSLLVKQRTGQAALPLARVEYWISRLGLTPTDATVLRQAFALAHASQYLLDVFPGWQKRARAISAKLGAIQPAGVRARGRA